MRDPRLATLARNIIGYSLKLRPGERVLIENAGLERDFVELLVEEAYKAGGQPFVNLRDPAITRALLLSAGEAQLKFWAEVDSKQMEGMDAYIGVRSGLNSAELADLPPEKMRLYTSLYHKPVHMERRVPKTRWVVMRYPNGAMAQAANQSTAAFEEFYFRVCNLDYAKMSRAMDPLVELMNRTDQVHILGEGTDLRFSIKGIPATKCDGQVNIPDGEVFTAPVKTSVNGVLSVNTPSLEEGFSYEGIRLTFKDGKIIEATANDDRRINALLDTDDGARFVGEFALGVNPHITAPMKDTLFDEKIGGSFHFTPGACYEDASNGNKSAIHWDLVTIQTPEYGGGEIWFDGELIRKNGLFLPGALQGLNPENLV
ncbi:MAG: aminopeptidase [Christensenellaceae bacterium]|jgi:aminopeptidase|nr:aminopeptidase [Christensenellaceae bacterium]